MWYINQQSSWMSSRRAARPISTMGKATGLAFGSQSAKVECYRMWSGAAISSLYLSALCALSFSLYRYLSRSCLLLCQKSENIFWTCSQAGSVWSQFSLGMSIFLQLILCPRGISSSSSKYLWLLSQILEKESPILSPSVAKLPQTRLSFITHHLYPSEVFVPHRSDVQFTRRRAFYLINQRAFSHGKKVGMSVSGCWSGVGSFYLVMGRIGVVLLGCLKRKRRVYRTYIRCVYGIFDDRRHVCNRRLVQRHIQGQRNPGTALLDRRLIALLISEGDLASTPPPFQSHPAAGVYSHQTAILDHRNAIQKPHLSLPKRKRRYCCLFGSEVMGAGVLGVGEQVVGTSVMVQSSFLLCRHCWSGEVAAVENFVPTRTT